MDGSDRLISSDVLIETIWPSHKSLSFIHLKHSKTNELIYNLYLSICIFIYLLHIYLCNNFHLLVLFVVSANRMRLIPNENIDVSNYFLLQTFFHSHITFVLFSNYVAKLLQHVFRCVSVCVCVWNERCVLTQIGCST